MSTTVPVTAEKTFKVAGISNLGGVYKPRFANDIARIKVLHKNGHTDIRLIELPNPMTKEEAAQYLLDTRSDDFNVFADDYAVFTLEDFLSVKEPKQKVSKKATAIVEQAVEQKVDVNSIIEDQLVETPVDLTDLYESVGLVPPTVYEDAVAEEEVDTEDQPF